MSWLESYSGILLFIYQLAFFYDQFWFTLYGGSPESIVISLTQFHRSLTLTGVQAWEMQWMPKAADLLFALVHKNNSLLPPPLLPLRKILKNSKNTVHVNSFFCINHWVPEGSSSQKSGVSWAKVFKFPLRQKFSLLAFTCMLCKRKVCISQYQTSWTWVTWYYTIKVVKLN